MTAVSVLGCVLAEGAKEATGGAAGADASLGEQPARIATETKIPANEILYAGMMVVGRSGTPTRIVRRAAPLVTLIRRVLKIKEI